MAAGQSSRREIQIGPASSADREWAAQLMAGSEPWTTFGRPLDVCRALFDDAEFHVFIGRMSGERCGFLVLDPRGLAGAPYLKSLAVADPFRGNGLGSSFVRFAEDHFRPHSRYLFLCVSSFNEGALRLYERLGYERVGTLPDLAVAGASEHLMSKRLR